MHGVSDALRKAIKAVLVIICILVLVLGTLVVYNLDSLPYIESKLDEWSENVFGSFAGLTPVFSQQLTPEFPDEIASPELPSPSDAVSSSQGVAVRSISFEHEIIDLSCGMKYMPTYAVIPQNADSSPVFSSSAPDVVEVTTEGIIARTAGSAIITVTDGAAQDTLEINVSDDSRERTLTAVDMLSTQAGGAGVFDGALSLRDDLARARTENARLLHTLLEQVCAYGLGKGESDALYDAADAVKTLGIKRETVLQAAASCSAVYEMNSADFTLTFAGDCTLARLNERGTGKYFPAVYEKSGSLTYPFDKVRGVFSADDITTINLECVLTDRSSHYDKQFYFRGSPEYAKMLPASSIEHANLANNHALDYYEKGRADTVKSLEENGVTYCYYDVMHTEEIATDSGIVKVIMLGYNQVGMGWPEDEADKLRSTIKQLAAPDTFVVVNMHWGTERATVPSRWQQEAARSLIDAGAKLVIGHHPHVLQGIEQYQDGYIAYSLGNFSFGGNTKANYPQTVIWRVACEMDEGEARIASISVVPCSTTSTGTADNNYQVALEYGERGEDIIDLLLERSAKIDGGISEINWHRIGL